MIARPHTTAALTIGKGGGAHVKLAPAPLRVRSSRAFAQRGERVRCVPSSTCHAVHPHPASTASTAAASFCG
eukprot:844628-Prymnesium_polylepis.1